MENQLKRSKYYFHYIYNYNSNNNNSTEKQLSDSCSSAFKFPIFYLENKQEINDNIKNDLELIESTDPSGVSMYTHIFKPLNALHPYIV